VTLIHSRDTVSLVIAIACLVPTVIVAAAEPLTRRQKIAAIAAIVSGAHYEFDGKLPSGNHVAKPDVLAEATRLRPELADPNLSLALNEAIRIQSQYEFNCRLTDTMSQADAWKSILNSQAAEPLRRELLSRQIRNKADYDALLDRFGKSYAAATAQTMREEMWSHRRRSFQTLWDKTLFSEFVMMNREKLDEPAVVVGTQTKCINLCVKNVSNADLTDVVVNICLIGPAGKSIRRTYFFHNLDRGETMAILMDDHEWEWGGGLIATSDNLQAKILVICNEGIQPKTSIVIANQIRRKEKSRSANALKPPQRVAGFAAGQPIAENDLRTASDAENTTRELAKTRQRITLFGTPQSKSKFRAKQVHLTFSEPTDPLVSQWGVPIVDIKAFIRVQLSDAGDSTTSIDLDGYFNSIVPSDAALELFSHGNLGVSDNRANELDPNYGRLTIYGDKYVLIFRGIRYSSKQ